MKNEVIKAKDDVDDKDMEMIELERLKERFEMQCEEYLTRFDNARKNSEIWKVSLDDQTKLAFDKEEEIIRI